MRQSRPSRSLSLAAARAVALFVLIPALGLGLAIESSASAGVGAATAARASGYGGGAMIAADPNGGYWTATAAGTVTPHGGAQVLGSPALSGLQLSKPIVGMAPTPDGGGYWLVASDGGIFNYGDAAFYGSTGSIHLNRPIVGMAATRDGHGYWLVASDGGIFSYGDAVFYGSTGSIHLNRAIVGMAATADGGGYWLVASDGGIFNYGDAAFYGSTGAIRLVQPIVGMAPTPDGAGYWMVAADGGVFTFGDAGYYGSTAGTGVSALGIVIDPPAPGYAVVTTTGAASLFGPPAPAITRPTPPPVPTTTTTARRATTTTTAPPTTTTTGLVTATAPTTSNLQQGAYVASVDPQGMAAFARETETSPTIATDYLPGNAGWPGMDGSGGSLNWLFVPWEGSGYTLSLGVPIIPTNSSGTAVGTLAQGATGAFNSYYVTLAQTLVAGGASNAYLRLGWEFDGSWMPWYAGTSSAEASFATYFQQIVTAMRSVSGEHFRFVWNPDAGAFTQSGYSVEAAYPGNDYVDVIGLDSYDQSWATPQTPTNAWSSTALPSLTASQQFASAEGKPLAFTEWGVTIRSDGHGLGDDPYYINHMVSWMDSSSNDVVFESYFDDDSGGVNATITGGSFPESRAAFTADFG
jgi:beta-mannanase